MGSMEWKIGCSGYHYADWKGKFYPEDLPSRKWFEFYGAHFNTLELNVTYYRLPKNETLQNWYNRSPKDFLFTVKAPRHITHFKKFKDAQRMIHDFMLAIAEGLKEKLGCILFQFPANFQYDQDRLMRIVDMQDLSARNVLEFRHESWWNTEVFEMLKKNDISFCGMSHPSLPEGVICTSDTLYYRFQGVPHLYTSLYQLQKLEQVAQSLSNHINIKQAFVYFNNTVEGHAITNAKQLQEICELVT